MENLLEGLLTTIHRVVSDLLQRYTENGREHNRLFCEQIIATNNQSMMMAATNGGADIDTVTKTITTQNEELEKLKKKYKS